jgi:endonuclease/exonuclease/phosphatase family metal-dependent hydrolase
MFKVLTFNCQHAYQEGFEPYIREIISERKYEFLLLQEVDEKVLEILEPLIETYRYKKLSVMSHNTNTPLRSCILYKPKFKFLRSDFITFSPIVLQEVNDSGSFAAIFKVPIRFTRLLGKKKIMVTVTHLHGSYRLVARKRELMALKKQVIHLDNENKCVKIIGGDFNNLIKGEGAYNDRIMKPDFINVTDFDGHTHDSTYLEHYYRNIPIVSLLFRKEKTYQTKIDHIYMDKESAKRIKHSSKPIDVVASDHRPVELVLRKN